MADALPFNPLDKPNLGKSIVDALLDRAAQPLASVAKIKGAGVYAIYYRGDFAPYAKLGLLNKTEAVHPIYVGKAIPQGGRKGVVMDASMESSALEARLRKHAESIKCVQSLNLADFSYRHLVVDDIWISLGETLLIQRFKPLWNQVVEGFGNNDPGGGRYTGMRPIWDELHPGRPWAAKCSPQSRPLEQILKSVSAYMEQTLNPTI